MAQIDNDEKVENLLDEDDDTVSEAVFNRFSAIELPVIGHIPLISECKALYANHRCLLFHTEDLVHNKMWEGADGCIILLQGYSRFVHHADGPLFQALH